MSIWEGELSPLGEIPGLGGSFRRILGNFQLKIQLNCSHLVVGLSGCISEGIGTVLGVVWTSEKVN